MAAGCRLQHLPSTDPVATELNSDRSERMDEANIRRSRLRLFSDSRGVCVKVVPSVINTLRRAKVDDQCFLQKV